MENNNQVEKFDPATLMDGVKNRIKATFVSLIPDDQWEQMCDAEMNKFFKPQYKKDHRGIETNEKISSQFETIVLELMQEKCKTHLKELLKSPEYSMQTIWEHNQNTHQSVHKTTLNAHLDALIKEKMPDMLVATLGQVMANSFYELFNNAQRQLQNYRP